MLSLQLGRNRMEKNDESFYSGAVAQRKKNKHTNKVINVLVSLQKTVNIKS